MLYNKSKTKTTYMRANTELTGVMPYPCFLPSSGLSPAAKEIYVLLLNRANLSRHNNWIDDQGRVYLIYTLDQLSADLEKSKSTIKAALNELCAEDLLERKRRGKGLANHLYIKLPPENLMLTVSPTPDETTVVSSGPDPPVSSPTITGSENRPTDSRKAGHNQR